MIVSSSGSGLREISSVNVRASREGRMSVEEGCEEIMCRKGECIQRGECEWRKREDGRLCGWGGERDGCEGLGVTCQDILEAIKR